MENKRQRQENNEHQIQVCMLLLGKQNFKYLLFSLNLFTLK